MKESELNWYELEALRFHRGGNLSFGEAESVLREFGKEIAEKLEPELKPVDMSALVNSGIDCLFWDDNSPNTSVGHLKDVDTAYPRPYLDAIEDLWHYCKPRMNYWFSSENFEDVKDLVKKLEEAGFELEIRCSITYVTGADHTSITAFMIKDKKADRCWSWEVE